eukprot:Skav214642  [mRNA]  locus=scaffold1009:213147:221604:- [translate_table: standard]
MKPAFGNLSISSDGLRLHRPAPWMAARAVFAGKAELKHPNAGVERKDHEKWVVQLAELVPIPVFPAESAAQ